MYINMKKVYRYGILLVIGLSLIFYGTIKFVIKDHSQVEPSDQEIIQRARGLGMLGLEDKLLLDAEEDE